MAPSPFSTRFWRGVTSPWFCSNGRLLPTRTTGASQRGASQFAEKQSTRGRLHYLTAETVFTTHGPFRAHSPAANQRVVYVGHGEPLAKSAGYWTTDERIGASVAVASSAIGRAFRCVQQGLRPSQVLLTGAPRNDRLLRSDRGEVRRAIADWLPADTSTLFLWLPTFRRNYAGQLDGVDSGAAIPLDLESLQRVDRWLAANGAAILVKPHPLSRAYPDGAFTRIRTIDDAGLRNARLSLASLLAAGGLPDHRRVVGVGRLSARRPATDLLFPRSGRVPHDASPQSGAVRRVVPRPVRHARRTDCSRRWRHVAGGGDPHGERREWLTQALHIHRDGDATARLLDALDLSQVSSRRLTFPGGGANEFRGYISTNSRAGESMLRRVPGCARGRRERGLTADERAHVEKRAGRFGLGARDSARLRSRRRGWPDLRRTPTAALPLGCVDRRSVHRGNSLRGTGEP